MKTNYITMALIAALFISTVAVQAAVGDAAAGATTGATAATTTGNAAKTNEENSAISSGDAATQAAKIATGTAEENTSGVDFSKYALIGGDLFLGAMSSTQRNIYDKKSKCYKHTKECRDELVNELFKNGLDFAQIANRAQVF